MPAILGGCTQTNVSCTDTLCLQVRMRCMPPYLLTKGLPLVASFVHVQACTMAEKRTDTEALAHASSEAIVMFLSRSVHASRC